MPASLPSPKTLLRIGAIFCLIGAAALKISGPPIFGYGTFRGEHMRALSVLLFTLFFPFALLHIEYEIAQKITKTALNDWVGYVQSFGCLALLLYGMALSLFLPGFSDTILLLVICVFGEAVFLINVVWSYFHPTSGVAIRRVTPRKPQGKWQWSRSPSQLFAVGTGVFAMVGFVFAIIRVPKLPYPMSGRVVLVSPALLGLAAAALFAFFALFYWVLESKGRRFHELTSRIHFMFTLAIVLDAVRAYTAWSQTTISKYAPSVSGGEFRGVFVFALLATITFLFNVFRDEIVGTRAAASPPVEPD